MTIVSRRRLLRSAASMSMAVFGSQWLGDDMALAKEYSLTYGVHPDFDAYVFAARDWTAKYHLRTKLQWYSDGTSVQAMLAGKMDAASPGVGPVVALNAALPGKLTLVMLWAYGDYSAALVRPDSPYRRMSDLKGRKVGVLVGSGAYLTWVAYLQGTGSQLSDFNVVNMSGEDIPAALSGKAVEAGVVWDPFVSLMTSKKIGRILAFFGKYANDMSALVMRTDVVRRHYDAVVRLVAGGMDCQEFIRRNPNEVAQLVSAQLRTQGIDVPWQDFVDSISKRLLWQPDFSLAVKKDLRNLGQVALKLGRIKRPPQYAFADDILNAAKQLRARH